MKVLPTIKSFEKSEADLLVVFVDRNWKKEIAFLDGEVRELLGKLASLENFSADYKETVFVDLPVNHIKRVMLYGVGKKKIKDVYDLEVLIGEAIGKIIKTKRNRITLVAFPEWFTTFSAELVGKAITEAIYLKIYKFVKYQKPEKGKGKELEISLFVKASRLTALERGIKTGYLFAQATNFARDLVNEPGAITTPLFLADCARNLTKKGEIKVEIFGRKEIEKMGMGGLLGVSRGSEIEPQFVRLSYKPQKQASSNIVLVGKGITFDTGGLSLKSGDAMETMKIDMAGAASILGVFSVIGKLKLSCSVIGLLPLCENMPSGKALKPGDILKLYDGKTVEVVNTDAEGRLILADALSYAVLKEKAKWVIDLATLTGSIMSALGEEIAGLFGNDEELLTKVKKAAKESGELVWPMPLFQGYKKQTESPVADLKNVTKSRYGGSITAALFLKEFVSNTPWIHLDIAGPAYAESKLALFTSGGTGFGVRLLLSLLMGN